MAVDDQLIIPSLVGLGQFLDLGQPEKNDILKSVREGASKNVPSPACHKCYNCHKIQDNL